jgi:hypothetical protein
MSIKRLILSTLLLAFSATAFADADLAGSWTMKLTPEGYPPRGARTLPKTLDIKQAGGKIDISATDFGGEKVLYACSLTQQCVIGNDQPGWWVRWDGAELVLELRHGKEPSQTLYRFYLSPDKQSLLLRALDDPQALAIPYNKQK